jgi:carbamoyltransferase
MGLAPYAKDEDVERLLVRLRSFVYPDSSDPLVFRSRFNNRDTLHSLDNQLRRTQFDHLAGATRRLVEELVVECVNEVVARTDIRTVVRSDAVVMVEKVNRLLEQYPSIERLWAVPSAGDESSPIGAAFLASQELGERNFASITNVYWGPSSTSSEVENALKETSAFRRYVVTRDDDIHSEVSHLLSAGGIVARFRGRMEFGACALGNRSIAHPSNCHVIHLIIEQVKTRDFRMPFAPPILGEWVDRFVAGTVKTPSHHNDGWVWVHQSSPHAPACLPGSVRPHHARRISYARRHPQLLRPLRKVRGAHRNGRGSEHALQY